MLGAFMKIHLLDTTDAKQKTEWKNFIENSNNGTIFHDLDFLDYHPAGKFNTHHLEFFEKGKLTAILPAALNIQDDGIKTLRSPYGASIGGFVFQPGLRIKTIMEIIKLLQEYSKDNKINTADIKLGPIPYMKIPDTVQQFSLLSSGFNLACSWVSYLVPLSPESDIVTELFSSNKKYEFNYGEKLGATAKETDISEIDSFYEILMETEARLGGKPTHTKEELIDLYNRLPGKIRIFMGYCEGRPASGVLIFMLNKKTAYTFYICGKTELKKYHPQLVTLGFLMKKLALEGVSHLDLGPTSFDNMQLNEGLAHFKEDLGGKGFTRDFFRWKA
ncbi:hypothetical protein OMAG_000246 [Candidatus Omnitrophus magneticus]|uniref:BioF2-like acetyltransferase domain-containing protein n=1 Tax=Candidatus Omnitrophus magneticus TaxID=1609969 RepID=A0A0F0CRI0_9BACT|nr:hypothetical protein OMAG_000246 [Candidatus Omnitrophus magneticus]